MWTIIFALLLILGLGAVFYLTASFRRFSFIKKIAEHHKAAAWAISFAAVCAISLPWFAVNIWTFLVVMIHLLAFQLLADGVSLLIRKITGKKPAKNYAGAAVLAFTAVYLACGWHIAHKIVETDYSLTTDKPLGADSLRIALIADSHLGITLDGNSFAEQIDRINEKDPDVLIISGDFVDDDSCREDMVRACEALSHVNTKYGVYFSFGNHDHGYSNYRDFTYAEMKEELIRNGVTVLEDETVMLSDNIRVIGRCDRSDSMRTPFAKMICADDVYNIVIDHQPNDYDAEAANGADLVLSGHTHGGHLFPAGYVGVLIGANDAFYGHEVRKNTDFIVTSGISGWAIPFKTGAKSEYVIIDVTN